MALTRCLLVLVVLFVCGSAFAHEGAPKRNVAYRLGIRSSVWAPASGAAGAWRAPGARSKASTPGRDTTLYGGAAPQPLWLTEGAALYYPELDTVGSVRHLHTDLTVRRPGDPTGDIGGYAYSAFGKVLKSTDPGGVAAPARAWSPFLWQGKRQLAPNLYDSRARVWSADLGAFLQPDEYVYLLRGGTLWSWPGQNPFRWRDPSGRDPIGRFVGTVIGGVFGADIGAVGGAAVGGGTTWETGPGVVVGVTGGALAGSAAGAAVGRYYGGNAGHVIGDALGALATSASEGLRDLFAEPLLAKKRDLEQIDWGSKKYGLDRGQRERLHREISKQGLTLEEIEEIAEEIAAERKLTGGERKDECPK